MVRPTFRIVLTLAVALALVLAVFPGFGTNLALAAGNQPAAKDGYNPLASTPPGIGYCYPSGYNRNGWRCGWRLAQAPYNLGTYNYYYNGYYPYYNYGWGGQVPPANNITDYGGAPRYGYYYNYYYPCYYYWNGYYYYCR